MPQELTTAEEILAAFERTLGRGSARIEFRHELSRDLARLKSPPIRRSGGSPLRRLSARLRGVLVRVLTVGVMRLLMRWWRHRAAQPAAGIIDFEAQRCMYGDPSQSKAVLIEGGRMWQGPFGTAVETLSSEPASRFQPLWLLDLVRGVVAAHEQPPQVLKGRTCRAFLAHADLNRVAEAVSYEVALPTGMDRLGDLRRIAVEVWVDDDGYLRRIRHTDAAAGVPISTTTVDLIELATELPADWSRLPSVPNDQLRP